MRWVAGMAVAAIAVLLFIALRERAAARATRATAGDQPAPAPAKADPEQPANEAIVISKALGGTGEPEDAVVPESEPVPDRRPDPPWLEERREETPPPAEVPIPLAGALSVDGDRTPNGTFQLAWRCRDGYDRSTVEVRGGAWSVVVPSGSKLTFDDIRLGGRLAIAVGPETVAPSSGRVTLTCRWFTPTVLRVLDEDTGTELAGVEIAKGDRSGIHPGPPSCAESVVTGAASPVTLPEEPGEQVYWVRASEHAWTRLQVVQGLRDERIVRLPKAGTLDVKVANFDPDSWAEVRLYEPSGRYLLSWPPAERVRIESLAPGQYRVRVEVGEWFRKPLRLGEALVEVEAGAVREVALTLARAPGPEGLVPLAGTLHIDPAWGAELQGGDICVRAVDAPPGYSDPEAYILDEDGRWSAGLVPPGRYSVDVHRWTWRQLVDVGPSGDPAVRIVVPPPCDVEVRVLLADRDEAAPLETLYWGLHEGSGRQGAAREAPGWFRFRAPLGDIDFDTHDDLEVEARVVELKPGLNRITLRAQRKYGLTIELRDAATGTEIPLDYDFCARITVAGIDDRECRSAGWSSSGWMGVTKPGRYRVMFSAEIDGFRSIDDQEVDVPAEGTARLVVHLRRK